MKNILLSKKTEQILFNKTELQIISLTKHVVQTSDFLKKIEKIRLKFPEENQNLKILENILEFRLLLGIIILDLTSSTRIYLNSKYQYEGLFSIRQIIVIINEGYKKIYNFKQSNSNGFEIIRYRNDSFWVKEIGNIIENKYSELKKDYYEITNELDIYFEQNFDNIKEQRDLSIHYDRKPLKVYQMLSKLEVESTFKKMIPFLNILNKMFDFTDKLIILLNKKTTDDKERIIDNLEKLFRKIQTKKT